MKNELLDRALIELRGEFEMYVIENGLVIDHIREDNLVVLNSKNMLIRMISNPALNKHITKIGFGTSSTPPASADTTISNMYARNVGTPAYDDANYKVTFPWSLPNNEGNGLTINEFGLMSTDGSLFARKLGGPVAKSSAIALEGTWSISF